MNLPTVLKINLRYYGRHRLLAVLCLLGISLGVGIVVAVELINESALSSFASSIDFLSGKATHSVISGYGRIDEDRFIRIWTNPHIKAASPVIEVMAHTKDTGDDLIRFLGLDPLLDAEFRNLAPREADREEFIRFLSSDIPAVYLSADLMERYGLKKGDRLTVITAGVEKPLRILGPLPGSNGFGRGENLAILDIAAAQEIFGRTGALDRIDIISSAGAEDLRRELPAGLELTDRTKRKSTLRAMLYSLQLNLAAMSLLALFVGTFLIYNFSMFSVLSRREDTSLLLTLGTDRKDLLGAFLAEAILLGAGGSLLGIGFGFLVAWFSIDRVASSISDLYFYLPVDRVHLTWPITLIGLGVGFLATFLGTALPALEVAVTPPILGMKRRTIEDRAHGLKGFLLVAGAVCCTGSFIAAWASRFSVFWGFAGAFGIALAFALFTPAFLSPFAHYWGLLMKRVFGSIEGFLAARSISASLSRTSIAVAALAVALSMTIGVDTMIYSFRESVRSWLDGSLLGDLYIAPGTTKWAHPLPAALIDEMKRHPDVTAVERYSTYEVRVKDRPVKLRIVDGAVLKDHSRFHFLKGKKGAWERLMAGGVFISESLRYRLGVHVGETVTLKTPTGDRAFPIVALTRDYSADQGAIHIDRLVYERIWKDRSVQSIALFLKPGASPNAIRSSLGREFPGLDRTIVSNAKMKEDIFAVFDETFAPTATLKGVSLLVALLGVATALMAILMERSRDMTVLGYLGLTPRQMAKTNVYQALTMGLAAFLVSVVCGTILTYIIVYAINYRSFGWSIDIGFDRWIFLKTLLLTGIACLASSIYPTYQLIKAQAGPSLEEE